MLGAGAVAFAASGLLLSTVAPGAAPAASSGMLLASLACTAGAFGLLVARVRRVEQENEGLVEELSQELARVKGRLDVVDAAHLAPREEAPGRRVVVK